MSAKRDRLHNEMVIPFFQDESMVSTVTYNSTGYDTRLGRSYPTNGLLILSMPTWTASGRIIARIQHSDTNSAYVTHFSFANALQTSGYTTFIGQFFRFKRWIRLRVDCKVAACTLTAFAVLARGKREPVTQQTGVATLSSGSSESSSSSSSESSSSSSESSSSSSS